MIPDLPLDEAAGPAATLAAEAGGLAALAAAHGVALVPMATPTSTDARLDLVAEAASAFVYCVSVTGVTGARQEVGAELPELIARLRARTAAPLAVGFGISTPQQAAHVASLADGVIIGSALIDLVSHSESAAAACTAVGRPGARRKRSHRRGDRHSPRVTPRRAPPRPHSTPPPQTVPLSAMATLCGATVSTNMPSHGARRIDCFALRTLLALEDK